MYIPWGLALAAAMWLVAAPATEERQLLGASAVLALCEVAIVAALATLFASFSSPFLTFVFTAGFGVTTAILSRSLTVMERMIDIQEKTTDVVGVMADKWKRLEKGEDDA